MWAGAAAAVAEVEDHFATSLSRRSLKAGGARRMASRVPPPGGRRPAPGAAPARARARGGGGKRFRRSWHYCSRLPISWLESPARYVRHEICGLPPLDIARQAAGCVGVQVTTPTEEAA